MEGKPDNQDRHSAENGLRPSSEQKVTEQAEVVIGGQVFRRTVLPAFTREDAAKRHKTMMRAYMNDDRYERPYRSGRDGVIEHDSQDRYYDS